MMDDARGATAAASLDIDRDENTSNNLNDSFGNENGNGILDKDNTASDHEDPDGYQGKRTSTALPDDLPKSLDDRRSVPVFSQETEMYDAWQGLFSLYSFLGGRFYYYNIWF